AMELVRDNDMHLRAFLGYAGWSAGQLEGELTEDYWITSDLQPELMAISPDVSLWRTVLGAISDEWLLEAGEPDDLSLN
ncbi:MAG: YqgE/AlgH family protein, partial [Verrucomicrobiota bacterium]